MWLRRVKRRVSEDLFEIMWICNIKRLQSAVYNVFVTMFGK